MIENSKTSIGTMIAGVAVVTGAGSGLGRALSHSLSTRGLTVIGIGSRKAPLEETKKLAKGQFFPMVVDVSDYKAVASAFSKIETIHGPIRILINNAAVYPRHDFLEETPENFMRVIEVNLGGTIACTHAALRTMKASGVGRIINVASFADIAPLPASSSYSVSKGAARIFTKALVADLGDRFPEIVVTDWVPGMLATKMGISNGIDPAIAAEWGATLALWHNQSLNGATFRQDLELLPPVSFRRRVKNKFLRRKVPIPRRILP